MSTIKFKTLTGGFSYQKDEGRIRQLVNISVGIELNPTTGMFSFTTGPNPGAPVAESYGMDTVFNNGNTTTSFSLNNALIIDGVEINGTWAEKMQALQAGIFKGENFITA